MPNAEVHDTISIAVGIPAITTTFLLLPTPEAAIGSIGYVLSSFLLSPDLDLNSEPLHRWGWFKVIWQPYMRWVPHRSWFSHGPIIGTLTRISYLLAIPVALLFVTVYALPLLASLLNQPELNKWALHVNPCVAKQWCVVHKWYFAAGFIGLEAGAMVHILSDWISTAYIRIRNKLFKK